MESNLLEKVNEKFKLTFKEEVKTKVSGMNFIIRSYEAEGLGAVSTMEAKMPLGLMKMDSIIVNPFEVDVPLLSYDRVFAFGNDSLFMEMYETRINKTDTPSYIKELKNLHNEYSFESEIRWYTEILFKESLHLKAKKKQALGFDKTKDIFMDNYLKWSLEADKCNKEEKIKEARKYTEGLLKNGGTSTDGFIKNKGREYTEKLFRDVLFQTK